MRTAMELQIENQERRSLREKRICSNCLNEYPTEIVALDVYKTSHFCGICGRPVIK